VKASAFALLVVSLTACNPQAPHVAASSTPRANRGPWLHIEQSGTARQPLHLYQQLGNRKQYDLVARSYESSGAQGTTVGTFFDARVTFVARNGRRLFATAPRAIIDQAASTLTLVGGVRARTDSGMTLNCDRLRYDQKTEMLHGQGHVVIAGAHGLHATGNRVDSDIALSRTVLQ
jgi:lipopolysaccharide assembly outer membrane protein LptD (OstA)